MKENKLLKTTIFYLIFSFLLFPAVAHSHNNHLNDFPPEAKTFLDVHFPRVDVRKIEYDHDEIEVELSNGAEIEFYHSGQWKSVKTHGEIPSSIVPKEVQNAINENFRNGIIYEIEKEIDGYEVKLTDGTELHLDFDGTIYHHEIYHHEHD